MLDLACHHRDARVMRFAVLLSLLAACTAPAPFAPLPDAGPDAEGPTTDAGPAADAGPSDVGSEPPDAPPPDAGERAGLATLFVGNSYVFVNDVSGHYRGLLEARVDPLRVEAVTAGGYTLAQHAADASTDGTPLAAFLRTGPAEDNAFDFVVLQEQSQLGGFPETDPARVASLAAARTLGGLVTARGAEVVLYLTWGRARGDAGNPALYPTFTAMQDRLDAGYLAMAAALRAEGARVRVAPVGGAFRLVHEAAVEAGLDPLGGGSDFLALYDPDGSHPSLRGAYLAACVFAGTTASLDVATLPDEPALGPEVSASLRAACAAALVDPRWDG
jgi:hypothetical protein